MSSSPRTPNQRELAVLALGALGVVYGDIGTSPLYAMREAFHGPFAMEITEGNILGVLSLVFWALATLICGKYLTLLLRMDHGGEGGDLALLTLLSRSQRVPIAFATAAALASTTLLYGDGVITPAVSVLGAVEGLKVLAPELGRYVVPITIAILLGIFALQRSGTGRIGVLFGPIMSVWFLSIAIAGLASLVRDPSVLRAINPWHAVRFLTETPKAFGVLGAVVLVVTGGEALYADLGHFGRWPIRAAWYTVALPSLLLNYFGQGAYLLAHPTEEVAGGLFFQLVPRPLLPMMVVIAALAAIIASQALISGCFSLTQQLMQLGFSPRMTVVHTSASMKGQIYIPTVSRWLLVGCVALVLAFRSSSNLTAAYGIAVTMARCLATILAAMVAYFRFRIALPIVLAIAAPIFAIEATLLASNLPKIPSGGWVPLAIGLVLFSIFSTWRWGRAKVGAADQDAVLGFDLFLADLQRKPRPRVPGTAMIMTRNTEGVPRLLLHHLKHNKVLHERVVLLTVETANEPRADADQRLELSELGQGIYRLIMRYGFMESPELPADMQQHLPALGFSFNINDTSFYLGRETLLPTGRSRLLRWRKGFYALMERSARSSRSYFGLPPNRVVELGAQVEF